MIIQPVEVVEIAKEIVDNKTYRKTSSDLIMTADGPNLLWACVLEQLGVPMRALFGTRAATNSMALWDEAVQKVLRMGGVRMQLEAYDILCLMHQQEVNAKESWQEIIPQIEALFSHMYM